MEIVRRVRSMKEVCRQARANGRRIGFVPTMGALHEGHLSLVRRVRELTDVIVVSIFVNPMQFGEGEDFAAYPRDLAQDVDLCIAEGVDYVFAPPDEEIYPEGSTTVVEVVGLSSSLEGASRAGHFRGVATVVTKLFAVLLPTVAAFGQKDAQQAAVIRRLVRDLMLDVEVLVLPTVRDGDGLALSSRNAYLTEDERHVALAIPRALETVRVAVERGEQQAAALLSTAREVLAAEPEISLDYLELVDPETFERVTQLAAETLLVVAARVGGTRLLDNVLLHP